MDISNMNSSAIQPPGQIGSLSSERELVDVSGLIIIVLLSRPARIHSDKPPTGLVQQPHFAAGHAAECPGVQWTRRRTAAYYSDIPHYLNLQLLSLMWCCRWT